MGRRHRALHAALKTGALFTYAAEAGAILAGASIDDRDRLRRFGVHFGAAFQLADDLDDAVGDHAAGRPSLAALLGPDAARRCSSRRRKRGRRLDPLGSAATCSARLPASWRGPTSSPAPPS